MVEMTFTEQECAPKLILSNRNVFSASCSRNSERWKWNRGCDWLPNTDSCSSFYLEGGSEAMWLLEA